MSGYLGDCSGCGDPVDSDDPHVWRSGELYCDSCSKDFTERETASAIHAIHGMPGEPEPDAALDLEIWRRKMIEGGQE